MVLSMTTHRTTTPRRMQTSIPVIFILYYLPYFYYTIRLHCLHEKPEGWHTLTGVPAVEAVTSIVFREWLPYFPLFSNIISMNRSRVIDKEQVAFLHSP